MSIKHTEYYKILEVSPTADQNEIKKAYKKKALKCHPDKGGSEEEFKNVSKVYQVLSDPEKRQQYNMYGEKGIEVDQNFDPNDMFQNMFSQMFNSGMNMNHNHRRSQKSQQRNGDISHNLVLTLEQLYNGIHKRLNVPISIKCNDCDGTGCKGKQPTCTVCNGSGQQTSIRQMGPMIMQQTSTCSNCHGSGKYITDDIKCKSCKGNAVIKQSNIHEINILPGLAHGQQLIIKGAGNYYPNSQPGNIIINITEKPHKFFERRGNDLFCKHTINIKEALCGFKFTINQLNNITLFIKNISIIEHNSIKTIQNKGMPIINTNNYGNLLIQFNFIFDKLDQLTLSDKQNIRNIFNEIYPSDDSDNITDNDESKYTLINF
jgi:DnaJ family protein A protein 2